MTRRRKLILVGIGGVVLTCICLCALIAIPSSNPSDEAMTVVATSEVAQVEQATMIEESIAEEATEDTEAEVAETTEAIQPTSTKQLVATNTPAPTKTQAPTATSPDQLRVANGSVNVRSGPGMNYEVIGALDAGEVVMVVARNNDGTWANVRLTDGSRAWVAASVVELVNFDSLQSVDLALTVPAPPVVQATNTTAPVVQATNTLPPVVQATNTLAPPPVAAVCDCSSGDILNCPNFNTHNEAQACYNFCVDTVGYDVHQLDGNDNDGLACESLP